MDAIFDFLNQGWVGLVAGVVLFIIGTALSYHFYRRSRQGAQLAYHYWSTRVLGAKGHALPEAVKITFRGEPIENLSRSLVMIWNNSDKTIYGRNIVESDPLRIDLGEKAKVLDSRIVKFTRSVNNCQLHLLVTLDEVMWAQTTIKFDYLDSGDGLVIETFHTEPGKAVRLLGSIHEMPRGFKNYKQLFPLGGPSKFFVVPTIGGLGVFLIGLGIDKFIRSDLDHATLPLIFGALLVSMMITALIIFRRRYRKALSMPEFTSK